MIHTLDILDRLVGFETISSHSNLDLIAYVETFLASRGFSVQRIPSQDATKSGLYAELGPAGQGVLLSAHTDVVPVEGQVWTRDPFRLTREGDLIYGRGTTDMKGYVACVLALADRASRTKLKEPLKIALSYDEEIGCVGLQHMLERLKPMLGQPRACIVGEPTEMQVAVGHKGKAALRAVCYGQSGHSALAPNFVNALYLAGDLMGKIRLIQEDVMLNGPRDDAYDIPYTTLHVGKLRGGIALNIVPDHAELTFEYRHLAADPAHEILGRIKDAADQVGRAYQSKWTEARIEIEQYNSYPGLDVTLTHPVVGFAQSLAHRNDATKVPFGTEAGIFDGLGIPTVVCGPGSMKDQGHKPDENISMSQIAACDAMMNRILDDLMA